MKLAKSIIALVFTIVNVFLLPYICLSVYGMYSPHVGFDLPELTYWNFFALLVLKGVLFFSRGHIYSYASFNVVATTDEEKDTVKEWVFTIAYLMMWFMSWVYYAIFF